MNNKLLLLGLIVLFVGFVNAGLFDFKSVEPPFFGCSITGCTMQGNIDMNNYAIYNASLVNASIVDLSLVEYDPVFTAENGTLWNAIISKLNITDQRYNDTQFILEQLLNYYNKTEINSLLQNFTYSNSTSQNFTYNETDPIFIANNVSIWQAISNKLNINDQRYNDTTLIYAINTSVWNELAFKLNIDDQRYNDTALINSVNSSLQSQIALQAADNLTQANLISSINNSLITLINQSNCVGENTFSIGFDGTYNYCNAVNTSALDIPFSSLNNYPAPCSPGYAITGLGDLVTCTAFLQFESDPIFVASNTSIWSAINSKLDINDQKYNDTAYINNLIPNYYNKTEVDGLLDNKLNINDQRYNETVAVIALSNREAANNATQAALINAKAGVGSCSSGYVVQNTTTGGVQCVAVGSISGSGTAGRIPKFSSTTGLTDSIITEANGKVGIGTTTPGNKLDVAGGLTVTGAISTGKGLGLSDEGPYKRIQSWEAEPLAINPLGNNVGIGTTMPGARLDVAGTMLVNRESVAYYRNVIHKAGAGSETGTLKITLPKTWSNTMMKVKIEGYNFAGGARGTSWSVVVGGYNDATAPAWYNYFAEIHGAAPFNLVRLAHDGTHNVILLGTTSSVWSYPRVAVTEFMASHSSITGWDTGWSISWITNETGITNIVTPTIDVFRDSTGNVGIGTTTPGNKLDVAGGLTVTGAISTGKGLGLSDEGPYKRIQSWEAEPLAINPLGNNVGIGTTMPGRKLDVADRMRVRSGATGTGGIWFSDSAGNELSFVGIESESADTVGIWNNGWRLVVNNNGNVGIGTTAPSTRLEVNGGVRLNTDVTKPTCSATYRGTMWMEKGGSNVADKLYICMKSLADTYSWVQVAMG